VADHSVLSRTVVLSLEFVVKPEHLKFVIPQSGPATVMPRISGSANATMFPVLSPEKITPTLCYVKVPVLFENRVLVYSPEE
jgi:hypothetical protein